MGIDGSEGEVKQPCQGEPGASAGDVINGLRLFMRMVNTAS
jgi:hypothetical protein